MTRRSIVAGIAAALLAACQAPPTRMADEERCDTPVCQVNIDVKGGYIDVKPQILRVTHPNATIHWVLQDGRYEFKADGIAFYDPKHTSQFFDPGPQLNGAQFQWKDRNNTKADPPWAYKITLYKRGSSEEPLTRDPAIVNDGG